VEKSLVVPLLVSQIEAANKLHSRLLQWQITDQALQSLHARFPGFGIEATLLKVVSVNQLYGTNVYAVMRMAQHITKVMLDANEREASELVEELASLGSRKHLSFASKFAHFFIDMERFPIYDSFAAKMVTYHLGIYPQGKNKAHPYRAFVENIDILKRYAHLYCTNTELDRYLWLGGLYRSWEKNKGAQINAEVAQLFNSLSSTPTTELAQLLDCLSTGHSPS
jgi:hypothetical protein